MGLFAPNGLLGSIPAPETNPKLASISGFSFRPNQLLTSAQPEETTRLEEPEELPKTGEHRSFQARDFDRS